MPSRLLRATLLTSDRWLDLPHPVERLAFVVLVLHADDLGTLDASDGQLVRMLRDACGTRSREDALKILGALVEADLVRTYEVDGKRYVFIPRSRQRFRAASFRRPPPPESMLVDEPDIAKNIKEINLHSSKMTDSRPSTDSQQSVRCQAPAPVVVVEGVVGDVVEVALNENLSQELPQEAPSRRKKPRRSQPKAIGEGDLILAMPCIGGETEIRASIVDEWQQTYPTVDVPATLREMRAWVHANPERRKVNVHRFVINWLKRENDRG